MRFLIFGDIVGKIGRKALAEVLPELRREHRPDVVLANAENLAHGLGMTAKTFGDVLDAGVTLFTGGNHVWDKPEGVELLRAPDARVIRPANYPPGAPGVGWITLSVDGKNVLVVNLLGRVFMKDLVDNPFRTFDAALESAGPADVVLVDFHAEVTSEKNAFGWYADGRASVVYGTHTHIPTADARILPKGTAFVTDVGMAGARDSVIGVDPEIALSRFLTQMPNRFEPAKGPAMLQGAVIRIDPDTGRGLSIERLRVPLAG